MAGLKFDFSAVNSALTPYSEFAMNQAVIEIFSPPLYNKLYPRMAKVRSDHFKKWILVQARGESKTSTRSIFEVAGNLLFSANPAKAGRPKKFYEMACKIEKNCR